MKVVSLLNKDLFERYMKEDFSNKSLPLDYHLDPTSELYTQYLEWAINDSTYLEGGNRRNFVCMIDDARFLMDEII